VIPYANKEEGTVYDHLKRAIRFSMEHLGKHGMPAGLYADWNDCLRLGKDGESTFVALQFYYALNHMQEFAELEKDQEYKAYAEKEMTKLGELINQYCWDEDRFTRGYTEEGEMIGRKAAEEANLWLNPQSWGVISGLATKAQAEESMEQVYERLNTAYGAILMDPPFHAHAFEGALAVIYNQGTKENAGIFSQSQGWLILAEALLGHGGRAFEYYMENCPSAQNERAEIRKLEPYCYGQFTEGKHSPHFGRSHVHWLTGTASTVMVGSVEGILGLRPDLSGLRLAPAIPAEWKHVQMEKYFRGKKLHITVENPYHVESGYKLLIVNGHRMTENYIPEDILEDENEIVLTM
jgi:cellobiose phosphorylase